MKSAGSRPAVAVDYSLAKDGFEIVDGTLETETLARLRHAMEGLPQRHRGGARNLLNDSKAVAELAAASPIKLLAEAALGGGSFPVRATFFDKSPEANWLVPWHQDTAIPVAERIETPGFYGWSVKAGVPHVHPPDSVLENMVALRIHLDDCGADNGPLRVLPGSHRFGKLEADAIERWRGRVAEFPCLVSAGGVLVMRPLLLHASSRAKTPTRRRVIHLECASSSLPNGLRWFAQNEAVTF